MTGKELVVSLLGMPIGRLVPTRRGARFAYESEVAREHVGMPLLSLSLPVKARPYAEGLACQKDVYPDAARRHEPGARRRLDALREQS